MKIRTSQVGIDGSSIYTVYVKRSNVLEWIGCVEERDSMCVLRVGSNSGLKCYVLTGRALRSGYILYALYIYISARLQYKSHIAHLPYCCQGGLLHYISVCICVDAMPRWMTESTYRRTCDVYRIASDASIVYVIVL